MYRLTLATALLGATLCCGPSLARGGATPASTSPAAAPSKALTAEEMAAISGGAEVDVAVLSRQQLTGSTSGNTINAGVLTSGQVTFGPNALNGFNGIGNFVINTGANNTLQGAINVSVVTAQPRS
jgi:hypothetical protein